MKICHSKHIQTITLIWVVCTVLMVFVYFVWALDRGFDITDESYYLLLAKHPESIKLMNSAQHWFTSSIWETTGSLHLFRGSGLAILILASAILSRGAIHAFAVASVVKRFQIRDVLIVYACFLSGAFLYGATINFSPCYNLISSVVAYSAVGITLQGVGRRVGSWSMMCHAFVGCILGVGFLNKFPAGLAVALVVLTFIVIFGESTRTKAIQVGAVAFGMLLSIAGIISFHLMTEDVWEQFQFGMSVFKAVQTETGGARLMRYASELCTQMFWCGAWMVGLFSVIATIPTAKRVKGLALYFQLGIVLLASIHLPGSFMTSSWRGISDLLPTLLSITLISTIGNWTTNRRSVVLTFGLLLLPYAAGAGTGNPINTQIVIALSSWGGVVAILTLAKQHEERGPGFELLACGIFTSVVAVQTGISAHTPYHIDKPMWQQTVATKIGKIGTVYTDRETHDFVTTLTGIKDNYLPKGGEPYFGFYDLPGVALILDAIPVFSPWLVHQKQADSLIARADPKLLESAVLGLRLESDGLLPAMPHQFSGFSTSWTNVGEATFPFGHQTVQIWIPDRH